MIPYGGLLFFYILALVSIPAIIMGFKGIPIKAYGMIASLLMVFLMVYSSRIQIICLVLFYLGQLILVKSFLYINSRCRSIWLMRFAVLLSILPLVLVKLSHMFTMHRIGFLGISYVTFKSVQILIEIYDGLINEVNAAGFTYFLLFFPTMSSGPIDRSRRFMEDINHSMPGEEYGMCFREGLWKIFNGIGYKFIASALISAFWINKIPDRHDVLNTLNYMYAYSMYLFFDFAGYSSIAVGTSYIYGVRTPDNFKLPFISRDIKEFWNRWHISLSFWFRDFIYTRFVMLAMKKKWYKSRLTASYIGYIITMGIMGLWHGTERYYILYGLYHGALIILTDIFQRKSKFYKRYNNSRLWNYASVFITFNLVCFGFLIFSGFLFIK